MQRLGDGHLAAAARTAAAAFHDDPLLKIVQPDVARRPAAGRWFMGVALTYALRHGEVWGNEDASAVAAWLPPDKHLSTMDLLRAGMARLPLVVGLRGAARTMGAMSATEPFHKQVKGPHWYLMMLATDPSRQGQGLGSQLTEVGTAQADAAGIPVYLETGTDANIAFYRKRGFEIMGQADAAGFTLTAMLRQPR